MDIKNYFDTLIILLTLHFLADFSLQNDFIASRKGKNWIFMIAHCLIWSGLIYIGLNTFRMDHWWSFPFLFLGHLIIDKWKCSRSGNGKELTMDLAIDQLLHVLQIVICVSL